MTHPLWLDLGQHWKWIALRGFAALLFGVLALLWPGLALTMLVIFWGAYALVDGLFSLIGAWRMRHEGEPLWPLLVVGVLGVVAGLAALLWPELTALGLLMLIAIWAIAIGALQIVAALRVRQLLDNEWWLGLSGTVALLFGLMVLVFPGAGALALVWLIGVFAVVFGVLLILLAWRLRGTEILGA
ncbi:HdeD family acid-resistance protein [Pseudomonas cavernae]|uniref:HdeD family acid-resistance protein n=1 Tax=Pseudomonas cavernae TaxID=2320867 RepID=A0A385YZX7_9PSED|nr:HdeD family acid-resistance protein [Pseudomonas cavernae]AYC31188.1 HdeD family acid-resistance protein [Pseudomonas cavernae]